jgi:hypothetical protein
MVGGSSTTKTGRHDIVEILLKVALNTKIQIQSTGYSPHFQVRGDNPKVEGISVGLFNLFTYFDMPFGW